MPKVYGYARVSTDRQVESGLSLQHQAKALRDHYEKCYKDTHEFAGVMQESRGVSAFKLPVHSRPVGKKVLALLKAGDILMVDKPDRLFRSMRDCENTLHWLEKRKASLCIVDFLGVTIDQNTWSGKLMLRNMVMFAELESVLRSHRLLDANAVKRSQGKVISSPKIGCEIDAEDRLFMPDETRDTAVRMWNMKQAGMSQREMREVMEEEWCNANGKPYRRSAFHVHHWSKESVRMYLRYGKMLAAGVHQDTIANMRSSDLRDATTEI